MTDLDAVRDWLRSGDTGISSKALCHAAFGLPDPLEWGVAAPRDPDDFGRCHRFLELFPEAREPAFRRLALVDPEWEVMIPRWDEMTALYLRELPSRMCRELYVLMVQLRDSVKESRR